MTSRDILGNERFGNRDNREQYVLDAAWALYMMSRRDVGEAKEQMQDRERDKREKRAKQREGEEEARKGEEKGSRPRHHSNWHTERLQAHSADRRITTFAIISKPKLPTGMEFAQGGHTVDMDDRSNTKEVSEPGDHTWLRIHVYPRNYILELRAATEETTEPSSDGFSLGKARDGTLWQVFGNPWQDNDFVYSIAPEHRVGQLREHRTKVAVQKMGGPTPFKSSGYIVSYLEDPNDQESWRGEDEVKERNSYLKACLDCHEYYDKPRKEALAMLVAFGLPEDDAIGIYCRQKLLHRSGWPLKHEEVPEMLDIFRRNPTRRGFRDTYYWLSNGSTGNLKLPVTVKLELEWGPRVHDLNPGPKEFDHCFPEQVQVLEEDNEYSDGDDWDEDGTDARNIRVLFDLAPGPPINRKPPVKFAADISSYPRTHIARLGDILQQGGSLLHPERLYGDLKVVGISLNEHLKQRSKPIEQEEKHRDG
ncbi:uncharacterized protein MYCGRDRAFT_94763 [Zymoseptoria tritici IPO323]|uniref:Uncharacterized protein n=1 Tax=Zymoseptoria tritici (strain CBS 115943 / IPO323) TaxID=336722 RepID=F9XEY1_ZYMTI|nr:uncharacterized protein MYCGRDRAFT_94763 [Zymoseptoria tritici IPO323]EGP85959.1 hypothetical protein MYCGRDRAFT_94763 [Zymoseptoria tritici IPO323]